VTIWKFWFLSRFPRVPVSTGTLGHPWKPFPRATAPNGFHGYPFRHPWKPFLVTGTRRNVSTGALSHPWKRFNVRFRRKWFPRRSGSHSGHPWKPLSRFHGCPVPRFPRRTGFHGCPFAPFGRRKSGSRFHGCPFALVSTSDFPSRNN